LFQGHNDDYTSPMDCGVCHVCVLVVPIYDMYLPNFCLEHSGSLRGVKVTAAKATVYFLQYMVRFIYFPFLITELCECDWESQTDSFNIYSYFAFTGGAASVTLLPISTWWVWVFGTPFIVLSCLTDHFLLINLTGNTLFF
jgi:hypothetical protein